MADINKNKEPKSKKVFTFISIILGAATFLGAVIAVYTLIKDDSPNIKFEILSDNNILEVKEKVSELQIKYQGEDILLQGKMLKVVNFRIYNNGAKDISTNDYDPQTPLGVKVTNATIVEKPTIERTSNNYLKEKLEIKIDSTTNQIYVNSVQFEKEQYFDIKVVILYNTKTPPVIEPKGKILGITKDLKFSEYTKENTNNIYGLARGSYDIYILAILVLIISNLVPFAQSWLKKSVISKEREKAKELIEVDTINNLQGQIKEILDKYKKTDQNHKF